VPIEAAFFVAPDQLAPSSEPQEPADLTSRPLRLLTSPVVPSVGLSPG
jgi:hypothetical protein